MQLLRLHNTLLTSALCGNSYPPSLLGLGNLQIGPIDWWLNWMMEVDLASAGNRFLLHMVGGLFATLLERDVQDKFIVEFNKPSSKFRLLLLRFVLPHRSDISTELFSEDAISFLLADLSREGSTSSFPGHLLGNTATERFVTERLMPLLPDAKQPLLKNLHEVLRQAGSRHGKRYHLDSPG